MGCTAVERKGGSARRALGGRAPSRRLTSSPPIRDREPILRRECPEDSLLHLISDEAFRPRLRRSANDRSFPSLHAVQSVQAEILRDGDAAIEQRGEKVGHGVACVLPCDDEDGDGLRSDELVDLEEVGAVQAGE